MKIFHYTTIEKLALILSNRTLRFNNAGNVNDPEECVTEDFGSFQPYCFLSCWTQSEQEFIPFWNIYADRGRGVRLEIDTQYIKFDGIDKSGYLFYIVQNVLKTKQNSYFINLWQDTESTNPYFKTNYSDEKKIFLKDCSTEFTTQWIHDFESALNTKKTCWSFENEVRFIMLGCECENAKNWQHVFNKILEKPLFSEKYVDLLLKQDFFDNLKIKLGPRVTESDKIIVNALINEFDIHKKIQLSQSSIKMR